MLLISIIFLSLAALGGMFLLTYVLQSKNTPKGVALIHGLIAATGLVLLIVYACYHTPAPLLSIIIFILTAMGGGMLIYRDLTGKSLPKWMAMGHGFAAIVGLISLLVFAFSK